MTSRKIYSYIAVAACITAVSCGIFSGGQPLRQCYVQGDLKVLLKGRNGDASTIFVYRKGEAIHTASLQPHPAIITRIVKDTICLAYFGGQGPGGKEGGADAGGVWIKWTMHAAGNPLETNAITAAKWAVNKDRLEVQSPGADVKLSFSLNQIVLDHERVLLLSGKSSKNTWRQIKFAGDTQEAFADQLEAYAEAGVEKQ